MKGTRTVRFWTKNTLRTDCRSPGDGYHPLVRVALSSRKAGLAWSISAGKSGHTGLPPLTSCNEPEVASSASRNCSADKRRGLRRKPKDSDKEPGSTTACR